MGVERDSGRTSAGFKHFFAPRPLDSKALSIAGIGVHERMRPSLIRRPQGTGDYLFMLFHDAAGAACEETAGAAVEWKPETMMIWRPGAGQFYGNGQKAYSHSWIHCEGTEIGRWLREAGLPVGRPFAVAAPELFSGCLLALYDELMAHVRPDAVIAANVLENGLRRIARGLRAGEAASAGEDVSENLLAVRRWIGTAPARKVTLGELARMAGMSVPHFCARFKAAFGQPPIACLIAQRLNHAAYLLADKNLGIAEIAARVGYEDGFHFSKAFKQHFGRSPRALRAERGGK